ncbi:hypothetical protein GCM10027447_11320 [Glycomyces halotolerans]
MRTTRRRIVAVTGASSGVGREAALAFAHKGAVVVLVARRKGALEHVAAQCRKTATAVLVRPADPTDPAAMEAVAADVHQRFGRIDVWVNAASVNMLSTSERYPDSAWRRRLEQRLFATYYGVRPVLPFMRGQGSGTVVNVPSVLSRSGRPFHSAFTASKDAMRAVTYCLRSEVADVEGIRVSTVVPGPVEPPETEVEDDQFAPLHHVLDPRRGARAVLSCVKSPGGEIGVDAAARPLSALFGLVQDAFARLRHRHGDRDPIVGTLGPTMEHRLVLPGREGRSSGGW